MLASINDCDHHYNTLFKSNIQLWAEHIHADIERNRTICVTGREETGKSRRAIKILTNELFVSLFLHRFRPTFYVDFLKWKICFKLFNIKSSLRMFSHVINESFMVGIISTKSFSLTFHSTTDFKDAVMIMRWQWRHGGARITQNNRRLVTDDDLN